MIVTTVFAVLCAWFTVAMFGSIVNNLYGKPPEAHTGPLTVRDRNKCIGKLVGLRKEIEGVVTLELTHPLSTEHPAARWQVWLAGWDQNFATARGGCVGTGNLTMDDAFLELTAMRDDYARVVETFIRTRSETIPQFDGVIQKLRQQP